MSDMREAFSDQYQIPCVDVEDPASTNADALISMCELIGAVRRVDGVEYCVALRDVGPELWTESALRKSVGKAEPNCPWCSAPRRDTFSFKCGSVAPSHVTPSPCQADSCRIGILQRERNTARELYLQERRKNRPMYPFPAWNRDHPQLETESREEWLTRWNQAEAALLAEYDAATEQAINMTTPEAKPDAQV